MVKAKSAVSTTSAAVVAARTTKRRALGDMTNSQQAQNGAAVVAGKEGVWLCGAMLLFYGANPKHHMLIHVALLLL